ncbi:hypothetical protein OESDEN_03817 [Oesophagostomum dentatum]|uniref:Uncharacterized protein n=1 Tax=Oesophagostomum dentatum TaxID=61180 RepID=A0A0B1TK87_OESDE|nr:hypothetical protein OESDEN_03817 [Oesophagostomum dentatum]
MLETSVADLLSRWDSTKDYLLDAEKRRANRSSSRESMSISADFSGISAVIYDALHDETSGIFDLMPLHVPSFENVGLPSSENSQFDGIYDWGGESDTLTHAYSDFSLFGSESHDTAVSASQSSSQEESYPNFVGWEESPTFPHISTFHGPYTSYSRCSLCQCRLSTSFASHQTHVRGRRHQQFMGRPRLPEPQAMRQMPTNPPGRRALMPRLQVRLHGLMTRMQGSPKKKELKRQKDSGILGCLPIRKTVLDLGEVIDGVVELPHRARRVSEIRRGAVEEREAEAMPVVETTPEDRFLVVHKRLALVGETQATTPGRAKIGPLLDGVFLTDIILGGRLAMAAIYNSVLVTSLRI